MINDLLQDLAQCVERNKIGDNDDQLAGEGGAVRSSARDVGTRQKRLKYSSTIFFSQKRFFCAA
jgi:hypothetical protein